MPTSFDHIFSEVWYILMKGGDPNIFDQIPCQNGVLQFARKSKIVKILGSIKFHQNIRNLQKIWSKPVGIGAYGTEWKVKK